MRTLYLDCFAGISGDMMVAALIDLGLDPAVLERELARLPLAGYRIQRSRVDRRGVQAARFEVILTGSAGERAADAGFVEVDRPGAGHPHPHPHPGHDHHHDHHHDHGHGHDHGHDHGHGGGHAHRPLAAILELLDRSDLAEPVRRMARDIFTALGRAEARVHGVPPDQVHFHEVGSTDAIVDVVSTAIGLQELGIERVVASPLHLGSGFVRCAHGLYPVPAPATANLLAGIPAYTSAARGELVTPTGAAIVATVAGRFGPMPPLVVSAVGYGAGARDREFPNVLRAFLGETAAGAAAGPGPGGAPLPDRASRDPFPEQHESPPGPAGYHEGPAVAIEASIDDMNPQLYEYLTARLLAAGALDVLLAPVQMKKGRPGHLLHVLAYPPSVDDLLAIVFAESTTIGVRTYAVTKRMLQRETRTAPTPYGPVQVKVARLGDRVVNVTPEYEDCRRLAEQTGIPLKDILALARSAAGLPGA